jgi:enterochelin esterase-like enzyme
MALIDPSMVWLLWLAAGAAFAWVVASWPKAAGPGLRMIVRRVTTQLLVLVLSLTAVAGTLNLQNGWYVSWSDLAASFGSAAPAGNVVTAGASAAGASAAVAAAGRLPWRAAPSPTPAVSRADAALSPNPGPNGQYRTYAISSPRNGVTGQVTIWFPQAYTDRAQALRRFPVIEAYHGIPGSAGSYSHSLKLGEMLAGQTAAGRLGPAVLVIPNYAPAQQDTECVNGGPGYLAMEDWLATDIPSWVRHHLRVQTSRDAWATIGYSAGGWCAAMTAMLHPQTFGAAIILGGYFKPIFADTYRPFAPGSALWNRYDLVRVAQNQPPKLALWIQTSPADPLSYLTTSELLAHARPPLSVTADVMKGAGHRMAVWVNLMPGAFAWLGSTIPGFKA